MKSVHGGVGARRRAGSDRGQRGATLVEAAFALPVFMVLVLGVVEFGLLMNDHLAVSSAVRAGTRTASAAGNDGHADLFTVLRVGRESSALDRSHIEYLVVYKPTSFGEAPSAACRAGMPVAGVCNVYTPTHFDLAAAQVAEETAQAEAEEANPKTSRRLDKSKVWFGCLTDGTYPHVGSSPDRYWCPKDRKIGQADNNGAGTDFVGVYLKIRHPWATKLFGDHKDLTDQSVIRLEPRTIGRTGAE